MACFLVDPGTVTSPVTTHYKFQQSVQMTVVVPRPQFIDRVGHWAGTVCNCAEEREDSGVQFCGELVNERCYTTTGAGVLTVQFIGELVTCPSLWRF